MAGMSRGTRLWIAACLASGLLAVAPGVAAGLSAADLAWIDQCIADRKIERLDPVKLRSYCECMQRIVEDNEPFTVAELEHSYPPAHLMCHDAAGLGKP